MKSRACLSAVFIMSAAGCATLTTPKTPDYYPNARFRSTPPAEVAADERDCIAMADEYVKQPNRYREMAKDALIGGAVGAGTGAVGGAITGNAGRGTGAGAAIGGILGVLKGASELNERSPSYERFVEHCLHQKGYEITGWTSK